MVGAVSLEDQAVSQADEVGDVAAQRDLAAELQAVEAAVAQEFPQQALGHGRFAAQTAGEGELVGAINHDENIMGTFAFVKIPMRFSERAIDPSSVGYADTFSRKGRRGCSRAGAGISPPRPQRIQRPRPRDQRHARELVPGSQTARTLGLASLPGRTSSWRSDG